MGKNKAKSGIMKQKDFNALGWICRNSLPQLKGIVTVVVLNGIGACTGTCTALLTKGLLDNAQTGNKTGLVRYAVFLAVLSVIQISLFVFTKYFSEKLWAKLDVCLKSRVFSIALKKEYAEINSYHSGEIINRLTGDVNAVTEAVATIPPSLVSITVRLVCAFTALAFMQWQFALIFFVGGILIYLSTLFLRGILKRLHGEMQKKEGIVRSFWQEIFEKLLVVKAFGAEEMAEKKSDVLQNDHYEAKVKKAAVGALSSGAANLVMRVGYIFSLVWCGRKLLYGEMTFGSLTAITSLVSQVQSPFSGLSGLMPRYYGALASAERIAEIENLTDEEENGSVKMSGFESLSVKNLTFSYDEKKVIDNVSFEVKRGEFVSVSGKSGVGKSTLFKLLLSIYKGDEGSIEFILDGNGYGVGKETRSLFAYVPQGNLLFSGTLRENLLFLVGEKSDEEIENALKIACAYDFVSSCTYGINTAVGEGGSGFSEGQIQRLAVARAILSDREILLFDEATSALDEKTEIQMLENIRKLTDKTCIMVTHKKAGSDICDKKICL